MSHVDRKEKQAKSNVRVDNKQTSKSYVRDDVKHKRSRSRDRFELTVSVGGKRKDWKKSDKKPFDDRKPFEEKQTPKKSDKGKEPLDDSSSSEEENFAKTPRKKPIVIKDAAIKQYAREKKVSLAKASVHLRALAIVQRKEKEREAQEIPLDLLGLAKQIVLSEPLDAPHATLYETAILDVIRFVSPVVDCGLTIVTESFFSEILTVVPTLPETPCDAILVIEPQLLNVNIDKVCALTSLSSTVFVALHTHPGVCGINNGIYWTRHNGQILENRGKMRRLIDDWTPIVSYTAYKNFKFRFYELKNDFVLMEILPFYDPPKNPVVYSSCVEQMDVTDLQNLDTSEKWSIAQTAEFLKKSLYSLIWENTPLNTSVLVHIETYNSLREIYNVKMFSGLNYDTCVTQVKSEFLRSSMGSACLSKDPEMFSKIVRGTTQAVMFRDRPFVETLCAIKSNTHGLKYVLPFRTSEPLPAKSKIRLPVYIAFFVFMYFFLGTFLTLFDFLTWPDPMITFIKPSASFFDAGKIYQLFLTLKIPSFWTVFVAPFVEEIIKINLPITGFLMLVLGEFYAYVQASIPYPAIFASNFVTRISPALFHLFTLVFYWFFDREAWTLKWMMLLHSYWNLSAQIKIFYPFPWFRDLFRNHIQYVLSEQDFENLILDFFARNETVDFSTYTVPDQNYSWMYHAMMLFYILMPLVTIFALWEIGIAFFTLSDHKIPHLRSQLIKTIAPDFDKCKTWVTQYLELEDRSTELAWWGPAPLVLMPIETHIFEEIPIDPDAKKLEIELYGRKTPISELNSMPEESPTHHLYPILISNQLMYTPKNSSKNVLSALYYRMYADPHLGQIKKGIRHILWRSTFDILVEHKVFLMEFQEISIQQAAEAMGGQKGKRLLEAADEQEKGSCSKFTKSYNVKWDETIPLKKNYIKPRAICNLGTHFHSATAHWARMLSAGLHKNWNENNIWPIKMFNREIPFILVYASGYDVQALSKMFEICSAAQAVSIIVSGDDSVVINNVYSGPCLFEGDFSMCDQSQDEGPLIEGFEKWTTQAGLPKDVQEIFMKSFSMPFVISKKNKSLKVVGDTGVKLPTGTTATTIVNSVDNCVAHIFAISSALEKNIDEFGKYPEYISQLGMNLKTQDVNLDTLTFLKGWWVSSKWIPLPSCILKIGKTLKDPRVLIKNSDHLYAVRRVAYEISVAFPHIPANYPIVSAWFSILKRLSVKSDKNIAKDYFIEDYKYKTKGSLVVLDENEICELYQKIYSRYGIIKRDIREFENLCESVVSLPALVAHPIVDVLFQRDYS